jgi:F-type H+-transporting ATPase subunit b
MVTDLILRVFNFTVFAAIMLKLTVKPIKQFFASRKEEIATTLDSLEKQKMAAQKALKAAKAELAAVEAQREGIIEQFIAEGEAEKEKILKKAEMAAERIKEMAQLTIDAEVRKSAEALKREIVEAAVQLGEQLLKDNIMPDDQQRLVDDYVTKVVEAH